MYCCHRSALLLPCIQIPTVTRTTATGTVETVVAMPKPLHVVFPEGFTRAEMASRVAAVAQNRGVQLRSVEAKLEGSMDIQGILGIDSDVRNGYDDIKVTFHIDADAPKKEIEAIVAQSQKRSAVYDIVTNPTNVTVEVL